MTFLATAWAWFSGLGWIAKIGTGLAALTPLAALNPIMGILAWCWNIITTVMGWIFEGFQNVIAHPVTLSIVVLAYIGGMWMQHDLDKRKIESYKIEAQNIAKKAEGVYNVEKAKAAAAIAARDAAKIQPLMDPEAFDIVAPVSPVNADHPVKASVPTIALDPTRPDFVRPGNTNHRRAKCDAVFCF